MSEVLSMISTVGFPIVACLGMFYFIVTTMKQFTGTLTELSKSVDNNTKVTARVLEYMEKGEKEK